MLLHSKADTLHLHTFCEYLLERERLSATPKGKLLAPLATTTQQDRRAEPTSPRRRLWKSVKSSSTQKVKSPSSSRSIQSFASSSVQHSLQANGGYHATRRRNSTKCQGRRKRRRNQSRIKGT
mmetsp:Transcript_4743/g.7288  ORF Transcript_4743/g.7288 Transcript_4743/m.7288 type:complete len:123 (+) Transcript_4743:197-565(+)